MHMQSKNNAMINVYNFILYDFFLSWLLNSDLYVTIKYDLYLNEGTVISTRNLWVCPFYPNENKHIFEFFFKLTSHTGL